MSTLRRAEELTRAIQERVGALVEELDGGTLREEQWQRPGGGGGRSRTLEGGALFEKAGVNWASVHGELPEAAWQSMTGAGEASPTDRRFAATGVSLVLHPDSPRVPTTHANWRYLELADRWWFGGGADLTPYYLEEEDARAFHAALKGACDAHDPAFHGRFKRWCDEYFHLPHRGEARGVGGIFFDRLADREPEALLAFVEDGADAFAAAYRGIVERRRDEPWGERERAWQLQRRGRYVEFNLLYDRGTLFGLRTGGRVESILMSLPPLVRWPVEVEPDPGTPEAELLDVLRRPREWA